VFEKPHLGVYVHTYGVSAKCRVRRAVVTVRQLRYCSGKPQVLLPFKGDMALPLSFLQNKTTP
jgi:hypothetical protein